MDAAEVASSPGSLSSPPHSPEQAAPNVPAIRAASGSHGVANTSNPTPASATSTPRLTAAGTIRKKPGPKPKPKPDPNTVEEKKTTTRKPRKVAEPKDPNALPAPRKRRTKASLEAQATPPADTTPPVTMPAQPQQLQQILQTRPVDAVPAPEQQPPPVTRVPSAAEPLHGNPSLTHINPAPTTPRPASSGQRYDPIRGGIIAASVPPPPISPPLNRASASPSITSLIDPPTSSNSPYPQSARLPQQATVTSNPLSPMALSGRPAQTLPSQDNHQPTRPAASLGPTPMEIDSEPSGKTSAPLPQSDVAMTNTPSNSNAPTPPVRPRQKEAPPPLPTGSGLLSGTPFGPVVNANGSTEATGTNIWITFPLKGRQNVTINFAQEVEKKYGFAALHPRIAARQERQRQITAAGAALERAAGIEPVDADDMSVGSDGESNGVATGVEEEGSTAGNGNGVKKRKKRKQEDYDKEDDFIDDTELAWEQQALMAQDGFFVYSGPLVTEEKPAVERADGAPRRGRGRGRGGTVRGETSGRGRGRGGGPGSRGGTTVRKPRVTKADRAAMEQEKQAREKLGMQLVDANKQPIMSHGGTLAAPAQ